jgi:hypothetical protein
LKTNESKQSVLNSSLQKAVEFFGAAGEFCRHSPFVEQQLAHFFYHAAAGRSLASMASIASG